MAELVKWVAQWPIWGFLSLVVIAWITQRIIAWRERRKKIEDIRLETYLSLVRPISDFNKLALEADAADGAGPTAELHRQGFEIMARLSMVGSCDVLDAFANYTHYVFNALKAKRRVAEAELRQLATNVTYAMCCEIHGERNRNSVPSRATTAASVSPALEGTRETSARVG